MAAVYWHVKLFVSLASYRLIGSLHKADHGDGDWIGFFVGDGDGDYWIGFLVGDGVWIGFLVDSGMEIGPEMCQIIAQCMVACSAAAELN